ncbi:hypothetical protein [Leeuwenhoekiella sp. NPDC079379]|uniref:hypothetical protein n=1 Tax=Leeuwenhoekiella sp. NPDC079379 TaxID=3364122 RepID=UPI0037C7EFB5
MRIWFLLSVFLVLSVNTLEAQDFKGITVEPGGSYPDTYNDKDKFREVKEAKLQLEYFLKQPDTENYILIVDGKVLKRNFFDEYKESILSYSISIYFIKNIDEIVGVPKRHQKMLILINTKNLEN